MLKWDKHNHDVFDIHFDELVAIIYIEHIAII